MKAELSADEQERIAGAPTENFKAYRLYMQRRQLRASREPDSLQLAQDYFKQALGQVAWEDIS